MANDKNSVPSSCIEAAVNGDQHKAFSHDEIAQQPNQDKQPPTAAHDQLLPNQHPLQPNQDKQPPSAAHDQLLPNQLTLQPNEIIRPMERDVYLAALSGSVDGLGSHDWKVMKTPLGNNVLHVFVGKPLKGNVASEDVGLFVPYVLEAMVAVQESLLLQINVNGETSLHLAARYGHADAVTAFLSWAKENHEGSDGLIGLINKRNTKEDTALHDAARGGHYCVVKLLIEAAIDNSVHLMPNSVGETPLYLAAEKDSVDSFGNILQVCKSLGQPLDHKGPCGLTALHVAVLCRSKGVVKEIVEKNSELIRVKNDQGQTALHYAAAQHARDLRILQLLLKNDNKYESAAYIQDDKGQTPLHVAALSWNFKGIEMIIHSYPDCIEMVDNSKQNVVHYAANLGCLHRFQKFLENAPSCDRLMNEKDQNGDTPLHLLAATTPSIPSHDCFVHLAKFIKKYEYILEVIAYNNQNLTAGDIIASNASLHHFAAVPPRKMSKILPRNRRGNTGVYGGEVATENVNSINIEDKNKNLKKVKDKISNLRKANETHLVVAALIATVSFTAGFTVPGGFYQNNADNGLADKAGLTGKTGLAVLGKQAAFQAFLISDTVAFTLSSLAIICYFVVARHEALVKVDTVSAGAHLLNSISLGALMIAFVAGVCAVVTNFPGLVITVIGISLVYFCFYFSLLLNSYDVLLTFMTRNSFKKARE